MINLNIIFIYAKGLKNAKKSKNSEYRLEFVPF